MNDTSDPVGNIERPFDPLDAGGISAEARIEYFDTHQVLFTQYQEKPRMVIGRRGSGKTAFLQSAHFTNADDLVVEVDKPKALSQIISLVSGIPLGGRYPEAVAELWDSIIYTRILQVAVERFENLRIGRDYLAKVGSSPTTSPDSIAWTLVDTLRETQSGKTIATIAELTRRLHSVSFHDARDELHSFLRLRHLRAIVLIDSLDSEGYVLEDLDTLAAIKGLLKWVGKVGSGTDPIEPRLSIPGEYYQAFLEISSNPLKDFSRSSVLRWTPRQLIGLAAKRFRKNLEIGRHPGFNKWRDADLETPNIALEMFREYMGNQMATSGGNLEDAFLFVLRHTQLLPRQLFVILNSIFQAKTLSHSGGEDLIRASVLSVMDVVVYEIVGAFHHKHPNVYSLVDRIIPLLPPLFNEAGSDRVFRRFRGQFWEMESYLAVLVEIGAIGKVVEKTTHYVRGQFQYNYDRSLILSTDDTLCVHPIFSSYFQSSPPKSGPEVWPVGL